MFLQSSDGKVNLRLDYGYNKTTGTVDYHWNQKGTFAKFGITDHTPVGFGGKFLYKAAKIFRWGGRALFVAGAVADIVSIVQAEDHLRQTVVVASGLAGAWAGVKVGGWLGAKIGTAEEPGGGTAVGALVGGAVGAIGGFFGARWAGGKVYDTIEKWYWPLHEEKP